MRIRIMAISDYVRNEVQEILLYLFFGVFFALLLPLIAGFSLHGFQESFESGLISISNYLGTFLVYLFMIIASLFLVIFPIASLLLIRKGELPATQSKPKWFRIFTVSWIFNVEGSALYQLSESIGLKGNRNFMNWSKNILRVIVFSILIFGTLGLIQVANPEFNVVGVPSSQQLTQQITPTSDVIFGAAIPAFAENGVLMFFLFLFMGVVAYFTSKMKDKKMALLTFFLVGILIVSPIVATGWASFHSLVYGNSDASLLATWIFGYLGSVITILTGVFIWFFSWHFFNNLFIKLSSVIEATEDIFFITIIILALIAILWGVIEFLLFRRKKKRRSSPEQ